MKKFLLLYEHGLDHALILLVGVRLSLGTSDGPYRRIIGEAADVTTIEIIYSYIFKSIRICFLWSQPSHKKESLIGSSKFQEKLATSHSRKKRGEA